RGDGGVDARARGRRLDRGLSRRLPLLRRRGAGADVSIERGQGRRDRCDRSDGRLRSRGRRRCASPGLRLLRVSSAPTIIDGASPYRWRQPGASRGWLAMGTRSTVYRWLQPGLSRGRRAIGTPTTADARALTLTTARQTTRP